MQTEFRLDQFLVEVILQKILGHQNAENGSLLVLQVSGGVRWSLIFPPPGF